MKVTITALTAITLTSVAAPAMGQRATKTQGTAPVFTSALPHNEQGMTIDPKVSTPVELSLLTRDSASGPGRRPSGSGSLPIEPPRLTWLAIDAALRPTPVADVRAGTDQIADGAAADWPAPSPVPAPGPAMITIVAGCLLSRRRRG